MTKHKPISIANTTTATAMTAPPSQPPNPSALSQQLDQLSLEKKTNISSPKRPSSKRKSKSDIVIGTNGTDTLQPVAQQQQQQQQPPPPTQSKRSPKAAKANGGTKQQFSTPSKPKSIPNGSSVPPQPYNNGVASDLATHYAGPTFHSSPAPSSLPMPSFFTSKPKTSLQNEYDLDTSSNQNTPIKAVKSLDGDSLHDDSPLALFFKADREEKSGLRNRGYGGGIMNGSPTVRPSSAGDFTHEHLDLRSTSPLLWNESPRKVNGRLDFKNHSTTDLPFQMDLEENPRNHLGHRFRATTEPPAENRAGSLARNKLFNHNKQYSEHSANFTPQRPSSAQSRQADLESSTQTLKNLLSINSTPSSRPASSLQQQPFTKGGVAPPSPSPAAHHSHNRSQSAAQSPHRRLPPATSASTTPRRIVSASGLPSPNRLTHPNHPQQPPTASTGAISEEDRNVKVEKELRKLLNLS